MLLKISVSFFTFISFIVKIQCKTFCVNNECFKLKDQIISSTDFFVSCIENSEVFVKLNSSIHNEIVGDLLKFRQLITAIYDFVFKCTKRVDLSLDPSPTENAEIVNIIFKFEFEPKYEISDATLKVLLGKIQNNSYCESVDLMKVKSFNNFLKKGSLISSYTNLSYLLIPKLVNVCQGNFITAEKDQKVTIAFEIPYQKANEKQKENLIEPPFKFNAVRKVEAGGYLLSSPEDGSFQHSPHGYPQEAGGEVNELSRSDSRKSSKMSIYKTEENQMENDHKITIISPNPEVFGTTDNLEKQEREREELNTTIVPGRSKFPIKYIKKEENKEEIKKEETKKEEVTSFLGVSSKINE